MVTTFSLIDENILSKLKDFWKQNNFSVGVPILDLQHVWLIYIVLRLEEQILESDSNSLDALASESLEETLQYAAEHFSLEEEIMKKFEYPSYTSHLETHRNFAEKIKEKYTKTNEDEVFALGLLSLLKKWLFNHILKEDKQYSEHLAKHSSEVRDFCSELLNQKKYSITKFQVQLYNEVTKEKTPEITEVETEDPIAQIRHIWNSYNLAIGIPIIDLQHIWLLKMTVELDLGLKRKEGIDPALLDKILQGALDYTKYHFSVEEKFMRYYRYVDFITHSNQHKRFIDFVIQRKEESKTGNPEVAKLLVKDLKNWLLSHIAFEDKKIGLFLGKRTREISEFTKKMHEKGELIILPEHKTLYKEIMKK